MDIPKTDLHHDAHHPYINAVASALSAAGYAVDDWWADADDPRDGEIQWPGRGGDVHIGWDEESGWHHGIDQAGHGEIRLVSWANLGVLPSPDDVVEWVRGLGDGIGSPGDRPRYREFDQFGTAFEGQLRAYWPPA